MDLTVNQAAALLGKKPRTVRHLAREGQLPAYREGGQWRIRREDLSASLEREAESRRGQIALLGDRVAGALADLTPPARPGKPTRGFYSVRDVQAFQVATEVLAELDRLPAAPAVERTRAHLLRFLAELTDGFHQFHPPLKIERFVAARGAACAAVASLASSEPALPAPLVDRLERDVLGSLRGLIRSAERRRR